MLEVRIKWVPGLQHWTDVVQFRDDWQEASPEAVATIKILVDAGNAIYGNDTHWMETREVASPDPI